MHVTNYKYTFKCGWTLLNYLECYYSLHMNETWLFKWFYVNMFGFSTNCNFKQTSFPFIKVATKIPMVRLKRPRAQNKQRSWHGSKREETKSWRNAPFNAYILQHLFHLLLLLSQLNKDHVHIRSKLCSFMKLHVNDRYTHNIQLETCKQFNSNINVNNSPHCCMQSIIISSKSRRLNDSLLSQTYLLLGVSTSRPWYQNLLFSGWYVSTQFLYLFM